MTSLMRVAYAALELYSPERDPAEIDLSDNTSRFGIPPAAAAALRSLPADSLTRYPETYAASLKQALSGYAGVPVECIATGCGSDDVIDSTIRAFGEPGDSIAIPDPSFAMIPSFARMNGMNPVLVPLDSDYGVNVESTNAVQAAITYICTPNNPTGTTIAAEAIDRIARASRGIVIVDEAYVEFATRSSADLIGRHPNIIVMRTLSKAFGLAGLRVGYAIGDPQLIAEVEKSRGPYKVSGVATAAATAALREDADWVRMRVRDTVANRDRLTRELLAREIEVAPSEANFVFAPLRDARRIAAAMRTRGVAVRPFDNLPAVSPALQRSCGAALRISVGPWDQVERALDALDEARSECA